MNPTPSARRPRNALLESLSATYNTVRECLPLAIGIHKAIKERQPDIDNRQLRTALKTHTASTRYLKALSQNATRYDLDGHPAGEVTAEQRQQAADALRERFKKAAEQRRAEEAARQRQDKLLKLAEKFNQR